MVSRYGGHRAIGASMGKLGRALPDPPRFVPYTSIPPTNNATGRGLREITVYGRIRGGIRAEKTMGLMGNRSRAPTWKSRGPDYLREIARYV